MNHGAKRRAMKGRRWTVKQISEWRAKQAKKLNTPQTIPPKINGYREGDEDRIDTRSATVVLEEWECKNCGFKCCFKEFACSECGLRGTKVKVVNNGKKNGE